MKTNERMKQLRAGVRDNGTVEGHIVETHLAHIYCLHHPRQYGCKVDHKNKFIAFTIDDGACDKEIRLPFEWVEAMKEWIDAGPPNGGSAAEAKGV